MENNNTNSRLDGQQSAIHTFLAEKAKHSDSVSPTKPNLQPQELSSIGGYRQPVAAGSNLTGINNVNQDFTLNLSLPTGGYYCPPSVATGSNNGGLPVAVAAGPDYGYYPPPSVAVAAGSNLNGGLPLGYHPLAAGSNLNGGLPVAVAAGPDYGYYPPPSVAVAAGSNLNGGLPLGYHPLAAGSNLNGGLPNYGYCPPLASNNDGLPDSTGTNSTQQPPLPPLPLDNDINFDHDGPSPAQGSNNNDAQQIVFKTQYGNEILTQKHIQTQQTMLARAKEKRATANDPVSRFKRYVEQNIEKLEFPINFYGIKPGKEGQDIDESQHREAKFPVFPLSAQQCQSNCKFHNNYNRSNRSDRIGVKTLKDSDEGYQPMEGLVHLQINLLSPGRDWLDPVLEWTESAPIGSKFAVTVDETDETVLQQNMHGKIPLFHFRRSSDRQKLKDLMVSITRRKQYAFNQVQKEPVKLQPSRHLCYLYRIAERRKLKKRARDVEKYESDDEEEMNVKQPSKKRGSKSSEKPAAKSKGSNKATAAKK